LLLACVLLCAAANTAATEKCVSLRITNCYARTVSVAYGPVTLCTEARVTPDARHRWLEVTYAYAEPDAVAPDISADDAPESLREPYKQDGPVGGSLVSLDGEQERIRHDRELRDLYGGTYIVTAITYADEARKRVCGRATARVIVR
jgi:hypothetical protein